MDIFIQKSGGFSTPETQINLLNISDIYRLSRRNFQKIINTKYTRVCKRYQSDWTDYATFGILD